MGADQIGPVFANLQRTLQEKRMATSVGELSVDRLIEWGVDTVFGLPGDGINGVFEALRANQEKIKFIQVRREKAAHLRRVGMRNTPAESACV